MTTAPDYMFFFEHSAKPTQQDFVLEIELNETTREPTIPFKVVNVFDISDIRELRSDGGRVEFYSVTAERASWNEFRITQ